MSKRWTRPFLLVVVPLLAIGTALTFWLWGGRYISTENAYVKADIVQVTAEIAGRLADVPIRDHQHVKAGDVLLKIDDEPYRIALLKAVAELDQAKTQVAGFKAQWAEAKLELHEAESRVKFFKQQLERQAELAKRGVTSSAKLEEAENNYTTARDRVAVIQGKIDRLLTMLAGDPKLPPEQHAMVREKASTVERAKLDLARTTIKAPVGGIAVNMKLQPGELIKAETPLFALVSETRPWVEANFKETELTHVKPGMKAKVVLDIYPDVTWEAEVDSISPATGAEFAILPPQNASGNWVKVVQRLPVKLRLIARSAEPSLRAGMTATVTVDTERERRLSQVMSWATIAATGQKKPPE